MTSARDELETVLVMRHVAQENAQELIDDLLREHAHELAQRQRAEASSIHLVEPREANGMFRGADLIDPKVTQ